MPARLLLALLILTFLPLRAAAQTLAQSQQAAVEQLYRQVLEREADPAGVTHYTGRLASGISMRENVRDMAHSAEYRARHITAASSGRQVVINLLRTLQARYPTPGEFTLENDAVWSGWDYVIDILISHQSYGDRFGDRMVPGDPVVQWDHAAAGVTLEANSAAPVLDRSMCLTVAMGSGAASECGDLRLAHELPAVRTLNKSRAPTLLYNQQHADPKPVVAAYVTLPANITADVVQAFLHVDGYGHIASGYYAAWTPGQERRIALTFDARNMPTGSYTYRLYVGLYSGGSNPWNVAHSGRIGIVNRSTSEFGAGWWMAGLERFYFQGDGTLFLVGGDGSHNLYRPVDGVANTWASAYTVDRPDTIFPTSYPSASFERRLAGGARVIYNGMGIQVATVNRLDQHTHFAYSNEAKFAWVAVPFQAGYTANKVRWSAQYGGPSGRIWRITSPDLGDNQGRTVALNADATGRVLSITDPDQHSVAFGYSASAPWRPQSRTDQRSTVTQFGYDAMGKVASSTVLMQGTGADITTTLRAFESRGYNNPVPMDSAYTFYDGPRGTETVNGQTTTVLDHTRFWIDRWGAPYRIRDASGAETVLARGNTRYPALVTQTWGPVREDGTRRTVAAVYDERGNLTSSTDYARSALRNGAVVYATTQYEYADPAWPHQPTAITQPEGEVTRLGYYSNGTRAWQQPGNDPARRVSFFYSARGLADSVKYPMGVTEAYRYDWWGNLDGTRTPKGAWTWYGNDGFGRNWRVDSPVNGAVRQIQEMTFYPNSDRVEYERTFGPDVGSGPLTRVVRTTYDTAGSPKSVARRSEPDPAGIGWVTTSFDYDAAGRKVREIAPDGLADSTFYDPAGNAVRFRSRRFWNQAVADPYVSMRYDAMGRLLERRTPPLVYAPRAEGMAAAPNPDLGPYPEMTVPGDTARYAYDAAGNMIRADNHDAWVRRGYNLDGSVRGDTLKTRTLAELSAVGGDSTSHVYALEHKYDLNGRRTDLTHPRQLGPNPGALGRTSSKYAYDPVTGALAQVTDPLGNEFRYHYDLLGRQDSLYYPGGLMERFGYDLDSQLTRNDLNNSARYLIPNSYSDAWLRQQDLQYDERGLMVWSGDYSGNRDTVTVSYDGLGQMASTGHVYRGQLVSTGQPAQYVESESPRHDALGNIVWMYRTGDVKVFERSWFDAGMAEGSSGETKWLYQNGTGRLLRRLTIEGRDTTVYNLAGDIVFTSQSANVGATAFDRVAYYAADGTLRRAVTRRRERFGSRDAPQYDVDEAYRYDALGRRVLVHTAKKCRDVGGPIARCAVGSLRRTVWDGNAELYDIQRPVSSTQTLVNITFSPAEMESDTAGVRALGNWDGFDPNVFYGRVAYTYGHSIDRPLSIVRMNYADQPYGKNLIRWEPFAIIPHWNPRGVAQTGTVNYGRRSWCQPNDASRCVYLDWQDSWFPYKPMRPIPEFWHGSLLTEKRDASGLLYRRNRYYDPASSRFTQEDPIGLAGGLNAYGYADGNPVTFADPFGLSASESCCLGLAYDGINPRRIQENAEWNESLTNRDRAGLGAIAVTATGIAVGGLMIGEGLVATAGTGSLAALRQEYVTAVQGLRGVGQRLLAQGYSEEAVARTLHTARRTLGVIYKGATPLPQRVVIYGRNIMRYGDRLGPTVEFLRRSGKSWGSIIDSAARTGGADLGL